jgi:hypothetical protein
MTREFKAADFAEIDEARKTIEALWDADMISTQTYQQAIEEIGDRSSEAVRDMPKSKGDRQ